MVARREEDIPIQGHTIPLKDSHLFSRRILDMAGVAQAACLCSSCELRVQPVNVGPKFPWTAVGVGECQPCPAQDVISSFYRWRMAVSR